MENVTWPVCSKFTFEKKKTTLPRYTFTRNCSSNGGTEYNATLYAHNSHFNKKKKESLSIQQNELLLFAYPFSSQIALGCFMLETFSNMDDGKIFRHNGTNGVTSNRSNKEKYKEKLCSLPCLAAHAAVLNLTVWKRKELVQIVMREKPVFCERLFSFSLHLPQSNDDDDGKWLLFRASGLVGK
ncbi:unnamed protein product [Orchesella dallaii]|uniref:Uncharacterized protein n=1 Tax=Orchesella dallaii TaxID=48710 RepID=A0ABP1Q8Q9_9HEXA